MAINSEEELESRMRGFRVIGDYDSSDDEYDIPASAIQYNRLDLLRELPVRHHELVSVAVNHSNIPCFLFLTEECGLSPNPQCYNVLSGDKSVEMAKFLESKGVGRITSAIQFAAYRGDMALVQYLHGKAFPRNGFEIQDAASRGHVHIMDWLFDHGYTVSAQIRFRALEHAITTRDCSSVDWLTMHGF